MIQKLIATSIVLLLFAGACQRPDPTASAPPPGKVRQLSLESSRSKDPTLDVLFVVDDSSSMTDKRGMIKKGLKASIRRLIVPECFGGRGNNSFSSPGQLFGEGGCPDGSDPAFAPFRSINIAVIPASFGSTGCASTARKSEVRVLKWREGTSKDLASLLENLDEEFASLATDGCSFQAPLESWYRFLVEPVPPAWSPSNQAGLFAPARNGDGGVVVDQAILNARENFMRPESYLSVVVVSDSDDCSVLAARNGSSAEEKDAHLLFDSEPMLAAPAICASNANDACCVSCQHPELLPAHCDQGQCAKVSNLSVSEDPVSLRCVDQRRRFGASFLYPKQRYVDALTHGLLVDADSGEMVPNPLLRGAGKYQGTARPSGKVFFHGLVGVPWQDVATNASLSDTYVMQYLSAAELQQRGWESSSANRWQLMMGEPGEPGSSPQCQESDAPANCGVAPIDPLDPFMIKSVQPRPQESNPLTGDVIASPESVTARENAINGHEMYVPREDELQYSCTFPLETPIECASYDPACICSSEPGQNRPICHTETDGAASTTQYFSGATPPLRLLSVLRNLGSNAVVNSLCAKLAIGSDTSNPNWGYNGLFSALSSRLRDHGGGCGNIRLNVDSEGFVDCEMLEVTRSDDDFPSTSLEQLDCEKSGRDEVSELVRARILTQLQGYFSCDVEGAHSCDEYRVCALRQLQGSPREQCLNDPSDEEKFPEPGFCFVDPKQLDAEGRALAGTNSDLLNSCLLQSGGVLRLVGGVPRSNSRLFIHCQEPELSSSGSAPPPPHPSESIVPPPAEEYEW